MTNDLTADFYFDPISPYAYLMWTRLRRDQARGEIQFALTPVPVVVSAIFAHWGIIGPADIPPKRRHFYRMCHWIADQHRIDLRIPDPHPFRSIEASRLIVALAARDTAVDAVFDAIFVEGRDLSQLSEIKALGRSLGIENISSALAANDVKERLRRNTESAISRGVFGVPTLSLGGESFWGFESYQMIQVFTQNPNKFGAFATRRLQDVDHVKTAGRWTVGS